MLLLQTSNAGSSLSTCCCCLSPIFILVGIVVVLIIFGKFLGGLGVRKASPPSDTVSKLNSDDLLRNLVSNAQKDRMNAAYLLKNNPTPLISHLIPIAATNYFNYREAEKAYQKAQSVKTTGDSAVAGVIVASAKSSRKSSYNEAKTRWESTIDGIKLYISISCDSIQSGLNELTGFIGSNPSNENIEQAELFAKYYGITLVEPLIELMKSPEENIRVGAIILLSALNDVRSYEPIKTALNDNSTNVRNAAAKAINAMHIPMVGDKTIVKEVVKLPCKYCGTLVEITETKCPSCGAPLKP